MKIGEIEKIGNRPLPVQVPTFNPRRQDTPAPAPAPERAPEKEKENV